MKKIEGIFYIYLAVNFIFQWIISNNDLRNNVIFSQSKCLIVHVLVTGAAGQEVRRVQLAAPAARTSPGNL